MRASLLAQAKSIYYYLNYLRMTDKRQKSTKVKGKRDESTTKTVNIPRIYSSVEKASEFCCISFAKDHKTLP